ncbi:MAG: DPP IV N-terminal domain-containing protein, partial [Phocaeicola sp.]
MKHAFLTIAMLLTGGMAMAQGTVKEYQQAYELRNKFSANKVYYDQVTPQWVENTNHFWYVRRTPEGKVYVKVDAVKQKRTDLFDHAKLISLLGKQSSKEITPTSLSLESVRVNRGLDTLNFAFNNQLWCYAVRSNQLTNKGVIPTPPKQKHWMEMDDEKVANPITSPNGEWVAYIKNHNVYVRSIATGTEKQLSIDGTLSNYYSAYIQWSPDSRKVMSCKIRPVEKRFVYYVESSPKDQLQPKLHKQEYAKPGDELPFRIPCIYEVESGRSIIPSTELFNQQYLISQFRWNADSKALTFEYNQRGHKAFRVLELSAETGAVRTIVDETSEKYVNYTRYFRYDLNNQKQLIWMSERDNWNHLYMYNRETATPMYQITKGEWYVRQVLHVDETNQTILFSANGMQPNEDPYLIRYYRIGFDGKGLTCLTPEEGMHRAWFSADKNYLVDVYSLVNKAPVAVLRSAKDGKVIMPLETADITELEAAGWKAPEVFVAKGRDGKSDMWGLIARPTNFD